MQDEESDPTEGSEISDTQDNLSKEIVWQALQTDISVDQRKKN